MLNTLDQLPEKKRNSPLDKNASKETPRPQPGQRITHLDEKQRETLRQFTVLLTNGEFTATALFPEVEKILKPCGCERELSTIADLMDDIEFEKAAQEMTSLTGMAEAYGTSHDK